MAQYSQTLIFQGLGTISITAPFAMDSLVVESKSSIPTLTNGGGVSALISTVKQGSSTILASSAGASGVRAVVPNVAAGDVISIVYTSANAVDAALNVIKSQISIFQGE